MATETEKRLMAVDILRGRNHNSKNASVAVGVLCALGHFTAAAKFAHDVDAVKDAERREHEIGGEGPECAEARLTLARRRSSLAETQKLIDRITDDIRCSGQ